MKRSVQTTTFADAVHANDDSRAERPVELGGHSLNPLLDQWDNLFHMSMGVGGALFAVFLTASAFAWRTHNLPVFAFALGMDALLLVLIAGRGLHVAARARRPLTGAQLDTLVREHADTELLCQAVLPRIQAQLARASSLTVWQAWRLRRLANRVREQQQDAQEKEVLAARRQAILTLSRGRGEACDASRDEGGLQCEAAPRSKDLPAQGERPPVIRVEAPTARSARAALLALGDDFSSPTWISQAVDAVIKRDPVKAAAEATALATLVEAWADEVLTHDAEGGRRGAQPAAAPGN